MANKRIPFVTAKKNYNSVDYFPFGNKPGDSFILISDPWDYLKAFLKSEHDGIKKRTPALGPQKERLNKALYFIKLAESFQRSAENVDLPTKGTLTYYSTLNIVKAFLLVRGHDLEKTVEYHGLSLNPNDKTDITISGNAQNGGINIFHAFAKELGYPVNPGDKISLKEIVSNLPEIHELVYNLNLLNTKKRKLLPVKIEFLSNEERWNKLTYKMYFERKHNENYRVEKFNSGDLKAKLDKDPESTETVIYLSKLVKNLTRSSESSWLSGYNEFCKEINDLNVRQLLTRLGYKYYIDLQPDQFSPPIYYFALMFYIGSVARYRPTLNEEILEKDYKPVISETMKSSPKQFLFMMTGMITKKICAMPLANLG
jgi:hypothetical protein